MEKPGGRQDGGRKEKGKEQKGGTGWGEQVKEAKRSLKEGNTDEGKVEGCRSVGNKRRKIKKVEGEKKLKTQRRETETEKSGSVEGRNVEGGGKTRGGTEHSSTPLLHHYSVTCPLHISTSSPVAPPSPIYFVEEPKGRLLS